MKRIVLKMTAIMIMAVLCVGFMSCSSDDDDKNNVVGTWVEDYGDGICTFTFRGNGTGVYVDRYNGNYGLETYSFNFNYRMHNDTSGDLIILDEHGDEDEVLPFLVDGNVMHIYEDYSYDDVEWILYKK